MSANILPTSVGLLDAADSLPGKFATTMDVPAKEMPLIANRHIEGSYKSQEEDHGKSKRQEFWGTVEAATVDVSSHSNSPNLHCPTSRLSPYYCDVCKTEMTGPEPYQQHLIGSSHAKRVKRQSLENSIVAGGTKPEERMLQSSGFVPPVPVPVLQSPASYYCSTCNISMSGIEPYQQHMRGIQHQKKQRKILLEQQMLSSETPVTPMRHESILLRNESPLQPNVAQPLGPQYYCQVCNISMSGIEPYEQHMRGGPHLKRVKNKELLEVHAHAQQQEAAACSEYFCNLCKKSMSGYEPFISHMSGIQHAKEKNRQRLMETSIDHPQSIVQSTPLASASMPDIPMSCRQGLKCDICAKRFSGIESLQDHFRSAKHQKKAQQAQRMDMSVESNNPVSDDSVSALAERVQSGLQISNRGTEGKRPMENITDELFRTCYANQDVQSHFNSFTGT